MKRSVVSLSALLAFSAPGMALAAAPTDEADIAAFGSSTYTYCDAKVLSHLWKKSIWDSKLLAGRKLRGGDGGVLRSAVGDARRATANLPAKRCSWDEAGFSYEDATKLAKLWNKSVIEAKAMMDQKIANGGEQNLHATLKQAAAPSRNAQADTNAFFSSRYTYCDAKVLANLWQTSLSESKERIGQKVRSKNENLLTPSLDKARRAVVNDANKRCTLAEAGFSYADAEKLGKIWKTPTSDAKVRAERKITMGDEKVLKDLLATKRK